MASFVGSANAPLPPPVELSPAEEKLPLKLPPPLSNFITTDTLNLSLSRIPSSSKNDTVTELTAPPRSPHRVLTSSDLPAIPLRPGEAKPMVEDAPADVPKKRSKDELRKECITEIYQTEKDYIVDLEIIIDVFIFPMRTMQVITEQVIYSIFSNLEVLINCNKEMLRELEQVIDAETGAEVQIGEVFTKLVSIFFEIFFL